jgi:hypothetical protein
MLPDFLYLKQTNLFNRELWIEIFRVLRLFPDFFLVVRDHKDFREKKLIILIFLNIVSGGVRRMFYYGFEINHSPYHPSFWSSPYHPIVEILRTTLC